MHHRDIQPAYDVTYWKGSVASDKSDATQAKLEVRNGPYVTDFRFDLNDPMQHQNLRNAKHMLELAFARGENLAKAEIRKALGVTEPRF